MAQINTAGLALVKRFEGCDLHAYQDAGGIWTVGFGHTGDVTPGEIITDTEAEALLMNDLERFEECVEKMVEVNLTPNAFSALVSFAYNIGCEALRASSLLQYVNEAHYSVNGVNAEFGAWVYCNGQILAGLVRRRTAEAALFLTP